MGTKNMGFRRVFNKNSKNPLFWFFSYLRLSDGQNWSEQKVKLIHASRAMHGYQNIGVSSNSTRYGFSIWYGFSSKYVNKYVSK